MSRSLRELDCDQAVEVLDRYTDPASHFAFNTYDRLPNPDAPLTPEDVLLANLLSLRLGWPEVTPLFAAGDDKPQALRRALEEALTWLRDAPAFEESASIEELEDVLAPVARANQATEGVSQWTAVTVSKVLHRRLPHIVPIIDSRVRAFYGVTKPAEVRSALWRDIRANLDWLPELAGCYRTSDGRALSVLRCADILIWSKN